MIHDSILIFTDGSSKGNPGPGGFGAVIVQGDDVAECGGREENTTNNRMELVAAIEALKQVKGSQEDIRVYSDSSYLINGITQWVHGWKKNGWKTATKKDVENRVLWEKLASLTSVYRRITWHKVAGHADTPGNARADEIASAFGEGARPKLYTGPLSGYSHDVGNIGMREGSVRRRGEAFSYVSRVDGVVQTHKTWKECEAHVRGKPGARFRKALTQEEERRIIAEFQK